MNERQFEAVSTVNGALLVLAGAGSGKTTVLVNRIACMMKYGNSYNSSNEPELTCEEIASINAYLNGDDDNPPEIATLRREAPRPYQILAITFTNKAANELKERIGAIDEGGGDVWAGTFHSTCARILRTYGDKLGFTRHFTIYDTDDGKRVVKDCFKRLNINEKILTVKSVMNEISRAKDSLIEPEEYSASAGSDFRKKQIASVYTEYAKALADSNAMDFDDLICCTVRLFRENPDVLEYYRKKFRYIMVDEYQDTNHAQYILVSMLAKGHNNICVVGDDDQSIYRFRGATIENILGFEKCFENVKTIRLEQNYRSTDNILNSANGVIAHNLGRKGKTLWTKNGEGAKISVCTAADERGEAMYVAEQILKNVSQGAKFSDHAVLYRMNAMSGIIESVFARSGILYKVIGGHRFYDRKEIKDVLSYLQFICNPTDDLRLRRIINEPKRGIGDASMNNAAQLAEGIGIPLYEVIQNAGNYESLSRPAAKMRAFCNVMDELIEQSDTLLPSELLRLVLHNTGYLDALRAAGHEEHERAENVEELVSAVVAYEEESDEPSLVEYLEEVALITDIDSYDATADRAVMMTLHSAKGLEFDNVFLIGLEEGIFPGTQSIYGGADDIEEERRLAYVGITRAKSCLHITRASRRMMFGMTAANPPSRFINELPKKCIELVPNRSATAKPRREYKSEHAISGAERFDMMNRTGAKTDRTAAKAATFSTGDRVEHKTFGVGTVTTVNPMGNDCLLTINFDKIGTKKLMANYAKLTVI